MREECGATEKAISASSGAVTSRLVVGLSCRTTERRHRLDGVKVGRVDREMEAVVTPVGHGEAKNEKQRGAKRLKKR